MKECPYCGNSTHAEFVDVGVGFSQVTPYLCNECGAMEIGSYDSYSYLSKTERKNGWYEPIPEWYGNPYCLYLKLRNIFFRFITRTILSVYPEYRKGKLKLNFKKVINNYKRGGK